MPITPNTATVTVSDSGSLKDAYNALSRSGGGTIEVAQGARPIEISLSGGGKDHVDIVSANDRAPTLLHRISFDKVENVTVSDFRIDSTGVSRPGWHKDVMVSGGGDIVIENSTFTSNAVGRYSPGQAGTVLGETLGLVRYTEDFSFDGNTVADYYHGLSIQETTSASVTGNAFSGLQGDGLRLAGVQQTVVSDNDMRDFIGTTRTFNHNDFIQVWSSNTKLLTRDLTISGNTLDSGDGSSAQGIFVGNERYRNGERDHRYQNIDIHDNVIHSGNTNGIAVFGANDVDIANNTVLWNRISNVVDEAGGSGTNRAPLIRFTNVTDGTMTDNIAKGYIPGGAILTGNETLNYTQPGDPDSVGANFVDALRGGAGRDLRLLSDSAWDGVKGAMQTWSSSATPPAVTPSEPEEMSEPEIPVVEGTPEPETTPEIEETPPTEEPPKSDDDLPPGLDLDPALPTTDLGRVVVDADFEAGASGGRFNQFDSRALVQSGTDTSYAIGADHVLQIARSVDGLHDLEAFSLEMDVTADTGDLSGALLHFYRTFEVTTARDGSLRFRLETDEGTFSVSTDGNPLADGEEHRLGVFYDDDLGKMSLRVDDVVVAEGEASGVTAEKSYYGLTLGHSWAEKGADSFSMLVDELVLRTRVAGDGPASTSAEEQPASTTDGLGQPSDLVQDTTRADLEIFL